VTTVRLVLELAALTMLFGIDMALALRFLTAKAFFPYHQAASGLAWSEVPGGLQAVLLAVLRVGGLGLLVLALAQLAAAVALVTFGATLVAWLALLSSVVYWVGMFLVTFGVHRRSGANTPWRASGVAAALALAGLAILAAAR